FASQALACLRQLGLPDDAPQVNPHGGAIALGHPLGMSGARLALTAVHGLEKEKGKLALATMCVGVGQGVSLAFERVWRFPLSRLRGRVGEGAFDDAQSAPSPALPRKRPQAGEGVTTTKRRPSRWQ